MNLVRNGNETKTVTRQPDSSFPFLCVALEIASRGLEGKDGREEEKRGMNQWDGSEERVGGAARGMADGKRERERAAQAAAAGAAARMPRQGRGERVKEARVKNGSQDGSGEWIKDFEAESAEEREKGRERGASDRTAIE